MALAAPAEKDGFYYAGDSLYCEASNLNRHRRATVPELKAHFGGKDTENRPAHWYEAQLIHYGLPPSKVKGTAHKRLFDAVMKGGLAVPAHIQKIEADLKKEWTKREREAKKVTKESAGGNSSAKGTKRKADQVSTNVSLNISVEVSSTGSSSVRAAQPAAKKTKASKPSSSCSTNVRAAQPASKRTKAPKPTSTNSPGPRRSGPSSSSVAGAPGYSADFSDAPPPYAEYDPGHASSSQTYHQPNPQGSPQPRLGLLNGRYRVECPHIEGNFPEHQDGLDLIATLDGDTLWLTFNFGIATGMMKVDRPRAPDPQYGTTMFWRGHALDNSLSQRFYALDTSNLAGPGNRLWFMGDGHISGIMQYSRQEFDFEAFRVPGESMYSEISRNEARAEWARLGGNEAALW